MSCATPSPEAAWASAKHVCWGLGLGHQDTEHSCRRVSGAGGGSWLLVRPRATGRAAICLEGPQFFPQGQEHGGPVRTAFPNPVKGAVSTTCWLVWCVCVCVCVCAGAVPWARAGQGRGGARPPGADARRKWAQQGNGTPRQMLNCPQPACLVLSVGAGNSGKTIAGVLDVSLGVMFSSQLAPCLLGVESLSRTQPGLVLRSGQRRGLGSSGWVGGCGGWRWRGHAVRLEG